MSSGSEVVRLGRGVEVLSCGRLVDVEEERLGKVVDEAVSVVVDAVSSVEDVC